MASSNDLSNYFRYEPLITDERIITAQREEYAKKHKIIMPRMADNACYLGIEVEIENVTRAVEIQGWRAVADGSLRNNGIEYVSNPIRGQNVYYMLHRLLEELKAQNAKFSERCSIHVHMNVRRLTVNQLVTLLMAYMVAEKSLYRFVQQAGFRRDRNIFCVPLQEGQHDLGLPYFLYLLRNGKANDAVSNIHRHWKKYSGLNIIPVSTLGTVEFRHMGGTFNLPLIMDWLNILQHLRMFAFNVSMEEAKNMIFALNTNSEYYVFLQRVFGKYAESLFDRNTKFSELESGVIAVKQAFALRQSLETREDNFVTSSLGEYIAAKYSTPIVPISKAHIEAELNALIKEMDEQYQKIRALEKKNRETPLSREEAREYSRVRGLYLDNDVRRAELQSKLDRIGLKALTKKKESIVAIYGGRR